jgi:hypothetical protein
MASRLSNYTLIAEMDLKYLFHFTKLEKKVVIRNLKHGGWILKGLQEKFLRTHHESKAEPSTQFQQWHRK